MAMRCSQHMCDWGRPVRRSSKRTSRTGEAFGHLPVVQGLVWRATGMSEAAAVAVSGYSTAAGLISATVRLGRIGGLEAQAVLAAVLETIADLSVPLDPHEEIESFMPWVDAAASRHAHAHLRLFAS